MSNIIKAGDPSVQVGFKFLTFAHYHKVVTDTVVTIKEVGETELGMMTVVAEFAKDGEVLATLSILPDPSWVRIPQWVCV